MENYPNYEMAIGAARRLFAFMARTSTDPTGVRIPKEIFRWTMVAAGASVVAVVIVESLAGRDGEPAE